MTQIDAKQLTEYEPVSIEHFGRDHWSTLAYAEVRAVDHGGAISPPHMRTDYRRHPGFPTPMSVGNAHGRYPTRLADGALDDHDDWDCLLDFAALGWIELGGDMPLEAWDVPRGARGPLARGRDGGIRAPGAHVTVRFTPDGNAAAAALRAFKAAGGNFATFRYDVASARFATVE